MAKKRLGFAPPKRANRDEMAEKRGRPQNPQLTIDKAWFSKRMKERGIRYFSDLGAEIGLTKSLVTKTLTHGTRMPTVNDVTGLANTLKVSTDEVLRRLGFPVPRSGVPIVGRITTDGKISPIVAKKGSLFKADDAPSDAEALMAETSNGPLAFVDGATFIYVPATPNSAVPPNAFGRLCIIEADNQLTPFLGVIMRSPVRGPIAIEMFGTREKVLVQTIHRASSVLSIHLP